MRPGLLWMAVLMLGVGCGHQTATRTANVASPSIATTHVTNARPVVTPNLRVSGEIERQCKLVVDSVPEAPKFAFDESELLPQDRAVLDQVVTCLMTGPLHGRSVQLVGRADPRGTVEYNFALGERRANTVERYLESSGITPGRLSETSRGELDATGSDESGWQVDRRVDIDLRM